MLDVSSSTTTATLVVSGDLDLCERDEFPLVAARVERLRRPHLVIDLCQLSFVDSTGAAFLISLAQAVQERGARTSLQGAGKRALFVLEICGAMEFFDVDADHICPPRTRSPYAQISAG